MPIKNFTKSSRGRMVRDSINFSGHAHIGRIARGHLCGSSAFLLLWIPVHHGDSRRQVFYRTVPLRSRC